MSLENNKSYERILTIIEKLVKTLRQDYVASRKQSIIGEREEVFRLFYNVKPIPIETQNNIIVFVDAGFHTLESDVLTLMIINVGGCIRDESGKIRFINELSDYQWPELIFVYAKWTEQGGEPYFTVQFIPVQEHGLLFSEDKAQKISENLTSMINQGLNKNIPRLKLIRLYKKLIKYIEGLIEVAYYVKISDLLVKRSLGVIDGTLNRWFSLRSIRFFDFDGVDVLSTITNRDKDLLINELSNIYGLVKTTKFTSIARARWLFKTDISNPLGLYTNTAPDAIEKTAMVINEKIRKKYGDEISEDIVSLFNRIIHPRTGLWAVRFPITTDGNVIMHFEVHTNEPLLEYNISTGAVPHLGKAVEIVEKVDQAVSDIMAHRSSIFGYPPYGFMELDSHVRIPMNRIYKIEDLFVNTIRKDTGEIGHPLEYLFENMRKIRLGYSW